jgi:sporulation protein YlmC with PRC-barrel domain
MAKLHQIRHVKPMLKRLSAVKVLCLLAAALISAPAAWAQTNAISLPLKARQLTGLKVENSDGQRVGTVRNLVVDIKTGRLRYVVIASGGFLGVRSTLKLAPAWAMSNATAKRGVLAVSATATQWSHAPVFKWSSLASLGEPNRAREIALDFQRASIGAFNAPTNSLTTTGREAATNSPAPELRFASDVIGLRVVNQKQEKIGEVTDLLVSFGAPRPSFAIISSGRLFHREHEYAVPLRGLRSSGDDGKLVLNADAAALQQAAPFNQQAWDARGRNDGIYRYSTLED